MSYSKILSATTSIEPWPDSPNTRLTAQSMVDTHAKSTTKWHNANAKVVTSFLGRSSCVVDKVLPGSPYDHDDANYCYKNRNCSHDQET